MAVSKITVTFKVTIDLPSNQNVEDALKFMRDNLAPGVEASKNRYTGMHHPRVSLLKQVVTYGDQE